MEHMEFLRDPNLELAKIVIGDEDMSLYEVYEAFGLYVGTPILENGESMHDIVLHDGKWCRKLIKSIEYEYKPIFE